MKIYTPLFALCLAMVPATASAQEAGDSDDVSVGVGCTQKTQYLGSNGGVFDTDPSTQCYARLTIDGAYVDGWVAEDFDGVADFGNEWNLAAGYAGGAGPINYEVGVAYYGLTDSGDVVNLAGTVSTDIEIGDGTLSPYAKADIYFSPQDGGPKSGVIGRLGTNYSLPLAESWTLGAGGEVFYDTGAFGFEEGVLGMAKASVSHAASDSLSLVLAGEVYTPISGANTLRETSGIVSIGMHATF